VRAANGGVAPDTVLIANGSDTSTFFDALSLSAITSARGYPILLVDRDGVPVATRDVLEEFAPSRTIVGGGPRTVSPEVGVTLGAVRWYGSDRYSTSTRIASNAVDAGMLDAECSGVAAKLPDALTGGSMVGSEGGPLLVTGCNALPAGAAGFLGSHSETMRTCYAFGGHRSVEPAVLSQIGDHLR
jgi:hypothetical protein